MSFELQNYAPVGATGNSNSPNIYSYRSETDTIADIAASDYFLTQRFELNEGDIIHAVGSDGYTQLSISSVTVSVDTVTEVYSNTSQSVTVTSIDDLPAAVAGDITLDDGVTYMATGPIVLTNTNLILGSGYVGLSSNGSANAGFQLVGTSSVTGGGTTSDIINIDGVTFFGQGSGILVDIDKAAQLTINECIISDNVDDASASIRINDVDTIRISSNNFTPITTGDGISFVGACEMLIISGNVFADQVNGNFIDLGTATFDGINITGNIFDVSAGDTGIEAAAAGANLNSGGKGVIASNTFAGAGTLVTANIVDGANNWILKEV